MREGKKRGEEIKAQKGITLRQKQKPNRTQDTGREQWRNEEESKVNGAEVHRGRKNMAGGN